MTKKDNRKFSNRPRTGDEQLGVKLRRLRAQHGVTLAQVADALGWTTTALRNYEVAQTMPPVPQLAELAHYYKVSLDRLCSHFTQPDELGDTT